jgi:hypothetical protein
MAVLCWALVAAFVSRLLSGSEADTGDALRLIAVAAGVSLLTVAAVTLARAAPRDERLHPRAEAQRELSS